MTILYIGVGILVVVIILAVSLIKFLGNPDNYR